MSEPLLHQARLGVGLRAIVVALSLAVGAILTGFYLSIRDDYGDEAAMKGYIESLLPVLDAWKGDHDAFPQSLTLLGHLPHAPLDESAWQYNATDDGQIFAFDFQDPRPAFLGFPGSFSFSSVDRIWHWSN